MENPITIEEDEGFSEPRTPVSEPKDNQRRWMQDQLCAPLRTCKILRTQLLDSSLVCKLFCCCLVFCNLVFLHLIFLFVIVIDRKKEIRS